MHVLIAGIGMHAGRGILGPFDLWDLVVGE
jgi:hypothetical protein